MKLGYYIKFNDDDVFLRGDYESISFKLLQVISYSKTFEVSDVKVFCDENVVKTATVADYILNTFFYYLGKELDLSEFEQLILF